MSALKARVTNDMKLAMKAKDKAALKAVRMILGAIKQREVDERIELDDAQVLTVIQKMVKQRKDSISQFQAGGRDDLVEKEENELKIVEKFLPEQLSYIEIEKIVSDSINSTGASNISDMGRVIKNVMEHVKGAADGKTISEITRKLLA